LYGEIKINKCVRNYFIDLEMALHNQKIICFVVKNHNEELIH